MIKCDAVLKQGISKKNGSQYVCLEVTLPNGYKKVIFPQNSAEKYVFSSNLNKV